jgi:hypothetical protein
VSCVLIVVVSKALGYAWLYRSEDYYDKRTTADSEFSAKSLADEPSSNGTRGTS